MPDIYKPIYLEEKKGMKFRPLHDRVVVQRMESEQKTAGGIIIPDSAQEKPMQGKILAVGGGVNGNCIGLIAAITNSDFCK